MKIKVVLKEYEGLLEKEFTIVLFADRKLDDNKRVKAWFDLNLEGTSSKCPPAIFGEEVNQIPNDCNFILEKLNEFNK